VLPYLGFACILAAVMWLMWRFARFANRRGIGGGLMGIADDLYHPIAKDQQEEHRVAEERTTPSPFPGDPDHHGDPDHGIRL
jgi:hypothetical protein